MKPFPLLVSIALFIGALSPVRAEIVKVTIASRTPVAEGKAYGQTGAGKSLGGLAAALERTLSPTQRVRRSRESNTTQP